MTDFTGIPQWVQAAKRQVTRDQEWMQYSKELFDLVSIYMEESGVSSFATLSTKEKTALILRAQGFLKDKDAFKRLFAKLSASLDEHLSSEKNSPRFSEQSKIRSEDVSEICSEAVEAVLTRWPDMKLHFTECLNASLSPRMRSIIWNAMLQNPAVNQKYSQLAKKSPKKLVSKYDLEIAQKCQLVIESDPTLQPLRKFKAASSVLRHVLSYHHVRSATKSGLSDTEYLVAVPFVFSLLLDYTNLKKKPKGLSAEMLAKIVEQFESFWEGRPTYSKVTDNSAGFEVFAESVLGILKYFDREMVQRLGDIFASERYSGASAAVSAVTLLLQPCIRCLFVSYLPLETVLFFYDQMIIGHEIENYDSLPYLSAVLIFLVYKELKDSSSWQEAERIFRNKLRNINFESIQGLINEKKLLCEMRKPIEAKASLDKYRFCLPLASLSDLPPWKHWHSDKLAVHLKSNVGEKLKAASSRAVDVAAFENKQEDRMSTPLHQVRAERDQLIEEVHLMKRELEDARRKLHEVESDKADVEKYADTEIERMQKKIAYLRKAHSLTPPPLLVNASKFGLTEPEYEDSETSSTVGAIPPPPTAEKETPPLISKSTSPVQEIEPETRKDETTTPSLPAVGTTTPSLSAVGIFNDMIGKLMLGVDALVHGVDRDRAALDRQTKTDLASIERAYEQAKVDVFGRIVSDDEVAALPEEQRREIASRLSRATKTQLIKMKLTR